MPGKSAKQRRPFIFGSIFWRFCQTCGARWPCWPPGFCAGTVQQHYRVLCRSCTTKQVRQCVCMCLLHLWSRPTERLEAFRNLCKFQSRQIQVLPESRSTTLVQDLDLHSCDLSHLAAILLSATRHIIFPIHDVLGKVCSECTEAPAVRSHLRRNAGISECFCLVRSCKILLKDETMKAGLDFPSGFLPCYHSILCESEQIKCQRHEFHEVKYLPLLHYCRGFGVTSVLKTSPRWGLNAKKMMWRWRSPSLRRSSQSSLDQFIQRSW